MNDSSSGKFGAILLCSKFSIFHWILQLEAIFPHPYQIWADNDYWRSAADSDNEKGNNYNFNDTNNLFM